MYKTLKELIKLEEKSWMVWQTSAFQHSYGKIDSRDKRISQKLAGQPAWTTQYNTVETTEENLPL